VLSNWFSKGRTKASAQQRVRPTLEVLEDRTAPAADILFSGGPTIPHVQVNNIVMGAQPLDTTALMQNLVRDYLPLLGGYYGIGAGSLRSSVSVAPFAGDPSIAQVQSFIVQEMNSGAVPPPDGNQLYFVFLPPGQSVGGMGEAGATGYHSNFWVYQDAAGYHISNIFPAGTQPIPIYYAVSFGTNEVSVTASHELAESVTDPTGTGYRDPTNPYGGEVADIYELLAPFTLDGYQVAVLSGPQGQIINSAASARPATMQDFVALIIDEAEGVAFRYLSMIDPQFRGEANAMESAVLANPFYGTQQGQTGMMYGEALAGSWFSQ
jgi:hypothetical protein